MKYIGTKKPHMSFPIYYYNGRWMANNYDKSDKVWYFYKSSREGVVIYEAYPTLQM